VTEAKQSIVDEIPILGRDEDRHSLQRFLAHYDVPAYVRRARQVEDAFDQLLRSCQRRREELLTVVRRRMSALRAVIGGWDALRPWLKDENQLRILQDLHDLLLI
jgi:hypothetical protein